MTRSYSIAIECAGRCHRHHGAIRRNCIGQPCYLAVDKAIATDRTAKLRAHSMINEETLPISMEEFSKLHCFLRDNGIGFGGEGKRQPVWFTYYPSYVYHTKLGRGIFLLIEVGVPYCYEMYSDSWNISYTIDVTRVKDPPYFGILRATNLGNFMEDYALLKVSGEILV